MATFGPLIASIVLRGEMVPPGGTEELYIVEVGGLVKAA
jgi:hypothetical protein